MFWIRYSTKDGGGNLVTTETSLSLAPMNVDYPETRTQSIRVTQDGAIVIQRPLRDSRPRRWLWNGYGPENEPYASQWTLLASLEARTRLEAGLPPSIGIWEDVSGVGGFDRLDGVGARVYTIVRVIQASRTPRSGGGPPSYESVFEFRIDDPSFTSF